MESTVFQETSNAFVLVSNPLWFTLQIKYVWTKSLSPDSDSEPHFNPPQDPRKGKRKTIMTKLFKTIQATHSHMSPAATKNLEVQKSHNSCKICPITMPVLIYRAYMYVCWIRNGHFLVKIIAKKNTTTQNTKPIQIKIQNSLSQYISDH